MALTPGDVRHVARLARLELDDEEVARLTEELGAILGYMERLDRVDTTGVEPLAHVHAAECPLRPDEVRPGSGADAAVAGAPEVEGTAFVVPRIIGEPT